MDTQAIDFSNVNPEDVKPMAAPDGNAPTTPIEQTINTTNTSTETDNSQGQGAPATETTMPATTETSNQLAEFFSRLATETGYEANSIEDVISLAAQHSTLREEVEKRKANPYEGLGLSPLAQKVIEAEKSGIDAGQVLKVLSLNVESLDAKERLRQKFLLDNPKLSKENPKLADMQFEKRFNSDYGILNKKFDNEEDRVDFEKENSEELEYAKQSLAYTAEQAASDLKAWQEQALKPKEPVQEQPYMLNGLAPEVYSQQVSDFVNQYNDVAVEIEEGLELTIGLPPEEKAKFVEALSNPFMLFSEMGFDLETGQVDLERMYGFMANQFIATNPKLIGERYLEAQNKKLVTTKLENPANRTMPTGGEPELSDLEEMARQVKERRGF